MKKFASLLLTVALLATMLTVFAVPASAAANDGGDPVNPFTPGEQLPPVILSGENSKWEKGSKDGVVVAASGAYDKLSAVYMDGEPIDESCLDVFPTAIAVDSDETSNGFAPSVIACLGGDSAASRIVEPERTVLFRVPWVDDAAAGGTHSDSGRQLAILLDDDSKEANPALAGKTVLLVDFPEDAAPSGGVRIRVRGGSTLGTSNDPLIVTDGSPSGSATIRIRGIGTINDNDPLYIIDGTPTKPGLHVLSYSGYDPTLKSRTAVTEDAGNGTSIILLVGVLAELPTDGESNALDVSAFTGIALKPEYLETLSVGSHTLKLVYADGAEVSTSIEIAAQTPTPPQTGDTGDITLWLILTALSATVLCACLIFGKKRKNVQ